MCKYLGSWLLTETKTRIEVLGHFSNPGFPFAEADAGRSKKILGYVKTLKAVDISLTRDISCRTSLTR